MPRAWGREFWAEKSLCKGPEAEALAVLIEQKEPGLGALELSRGRPERVLAEPQRHPGEDKMDAGR